MHRCRKAEWITLEPNEFTTKEDDKWGHANINPVASFKVSSLEYYFLYLSIIVTQKDV